MSRKIINGKPELSRYMKWGICVFCGEDLVMFNESPHEGLHTGPCYDEAVKIVKEYITSEETIIK